MRFRSKNSCSIFSKLKNYIWPHMGWGRMARYTRLRILRIRDTSQKVAAGLAVGVAVSFTPLIGTHLLQAALFAYLFRCNVLAALIGTLIGNPWTFPFMWWAAIKLGVYIFAVMGVSVAPVFPDGLNVGNLWDMAMNDPLQIFLPWLVGGYWLALIAAPLSYFIFLSMIKTARKAREVTRNKKLKQSEESKDL